MEIFIIVDVNFKVMEDISVMSTHTSLELAFRQAIKDVEQKEGKDIFVHNHKIEGYTTKESRVTNNNSLGSDYGVTYNSKYGNYPCARMIIKKTLNQTN
jgi:hypothetical protein